jgi:hypothetical protein
MVSHAFASSVVAFAIGWNIVSLAHAARRQEPVAMNPALLAALIMAFIALQVDA